MHSTRCRATTTRRSLALLFTLIVVTLLASCTGGKDGTPGPTGATGGTGSSGGPPPPGPIVALDISTAKTVTAAITTVSTGSWPVVTFKLVDETGNPLKGLTAGSIRFAIAQLLPQSDGSTQWRNYLITLDAASAVGWGTHDAVQPTAEVATLGTFTDNGDGSYNYKFSQSLDNLATAAQAAYSTAGRIPTGITIAYDGSLTHRVGFELRAATGVILPTVTNNATYDYLPATGSTTLTTVRRIISDKECDACHAKLAMHGGPRIDVEYCVLCHNGGNADAQSGNILDLRVLVHKLHSGSVLPSVKADANHGLIPTPGVGYVIYGYGGSVNNFNTFVWPQDTRNCTTCHNTSDANTPQASNYLIASATACGACHDNIDFTATTVVKHTAGAGPIADADCMNSGCHSATTPGTAAIGGGKVDIVTAHTVNVLSKMTKYKLNVSRVIALQSDKTTVEPACATKLAAAAAGTAVLCTVPPGDYIQVGITVTDPTNSNAKYDLSQPPFSTFGSTISARAAWTTLNYTNPGAIVGSGTPQAQTVNFLAKIGTASNGPAPTTTATNSATSVIPSLPAVVYGNSGADKTMLVAQFPYPVPLVSERSLKGGSGGIGLQASLVHTAVADVGVAVPQVSGSNPAVYGLAVPVQSADPAYFAITDNNAVARRQVVDYNNCLRCHKKLVLHSSRVNQVQFCVMCHNPAQAPRVQATGALAGSSGSEPVDFKFFIHGIHSAQYKAGVVDMTGVGFPGQLTNCLGCHKTDTFYPVDPAAVFSTTIDPGQTYSTTRFQGYDDPTQHYAITPNAAACGSCHTTAIAQNHMKQQGAIIVADLIDNSAKAPANVGMLGLGFGTTNTFVNGAPHIKAIDGSTLPQYQTESCGICHGKGATADVAVAHGTASFKYN